MSKHANPESAYLWLDCDAYRGTAGAARPDLSDLSENATYEGFEAYGGLETGFAVTAEGAATPLRVMNYRQAPYKVSREPKTNNITFKGVDVESKAYLETIATGGNFLQYPDGTVEIEEGTAEEFSLLLIARDGEDAAAYWSPRVTLGTPPATAATDGNTLEGAEFSIIALQPLRRVYQGLPTGLDEADVVQVDATGKAIETP